MLLGLCIISCSNNGMSGGGGIDIGNPVEFCVIDTMHRSVSDARIMVISSDIWFENVFNKRNVFVDSLRTDESGYVLFDSLKSGIYNFQIDHALGGAFLFDVNIKGVNYPNEIMIRNYGTIRGKIISGSGIPDQVCIEGSAYSASVNNDGSYLLPAVAQGSFTPVVMSSDSQWAFIDVINISSLDTTVNTIEISFTDLLIDDFEDSDSTKKIGKFIEGGYIYAKHAESTGTSAGYKIVPEGVVGNALNGTLVRNGMWALVGFFIGAKPDGDSIWDFRSASGISFYAKGSGKLNVSIESDTIEKMGYYKHYSSDIVLQPQWSHFVIPFDSLTFYADHNPDPNIPWNEAARSIKRIEFNALEGDTVQLWLDNLTLDGVDFSKIY